MKKLSALLLMGLYVLGVQPASASLASRENISVKVTHSHAHGHSHHDHGHDHHHHEHESSEEARSSDSAPVHNESHSHEISVVSCVASHVPQQASFLKIMLSSEGLVYPKLEPEHPVLRLSSIFRPPISR